MGKRKTSFTDTFRGNPLRPKDGQISKDRKHYWDGRTKSWKKYSEPREIVKGDPHKFFGTGDYGAGGPKETKRSKLSVKNNSSNNNTNNKKNNTNNNQKPKYKKGPVVKSVGTVDFNINTPEGLSAYNKAKNASKGKTNDKEKDKATTEALYGERNRKNAPINKKGNKFTSTVHTRHYKTGERLGVMTRNQRRAYEKAAMGKDGKLRTFEGEVAKHEKSSGHGKSHLRETLYKRSARGGPNRSGLQAGKTESSSTGSDKHKPGGPNSQFNKDRTPKTPLKKKKKQNKGFFHTDSQGNWDPGGISGHFDG